MRRGRDNAIIRNEQGQVLAINLGADFTAEHEWGIEDLRQKFKMSEKGLGIKSRAIKAIPKTLRFINTAKHTTLLVTSYVTGEESERIDLKRYELGTFRDETLVTAWDGGTFGISATSDDTRAALKEIHQALLDLDLCIWIGGGGVFENGGLMLVIKSRISQEKVDAIYAADQDYELLQKTALKTGIEKTLKAAGKGWYALVPKWTKVTTENESKYPIEFWLNPQDQTNHNFGWYTVEELLLWAQNKGPVLKEEA